MAGDPHAYWQRQIFAVRDERHSALRDGAKIHKVIELDVDRFEVAGFVEPLTSEWNSPTVLVKRKDWGYPIVLDYGQLYQVTVTRGDRQ